MITHNVEQRSKDWFDLRSGRMSASHAAAIAANGKGLETYIHKLMTEYYSKAPQETYTSDAMQRGIELEASAAFMYQMQTGQEVTTVGFVSLDEYVGCSPDRFVGDDGLIEIKCPLDVEYFRMLLGGDPKPEYVWQVQMQLLITGRDWCDFVNYSPNYDQELVIHRIEPDEIMLSKLRDGIRSGTRMIQEIKQKMEKILRAE